MRTYRGYTDEQVIAAAAEVKSMAQLLAKLGLKVAGGNYANMKRILQRLDLTCDHWRGQAWNKDQQLKDWSEYTQVSSAKPHLIKKRGHKCERCNREKWEGELIPIEIDHINGDRTDNREENLKLYCPNCHALTPTWRGRNNRGYKVEQTERQIAIAKQKRKIKPKIDKPKADPQWRTKPKPHLRKVVRPEKEELEQMIKNMTWTAIGKEHGVSDNAVRKWAKAYGI